MAVPHFIHVIDDCAMLGAEDCIQRLAQLLRQAVVLQINIAVVDPQNLFVGGPPPGVLHGSAVSGGPCRRGSELKLTKLSTEVAKCMW